MCNVNVHRLGLTDVERADIFVKWLEAVQATRAPEMVQDEVRARFLAEVAEVRLS